MLMDPTIRYSKTQCPQTIEEKAAMRKIPYHEAVGALMYCAVATRPDIAFPTTLLSQFVENPGPLHWEVVKHIFRYLPLENQARRHGITGIMPLV